VGGEPRESVNPNHNFIVKVDWIILPPPSHCLPSWRGWMKEDFPISAQERIREHSERMMPTRVVSVWTEALSINEYIVLKRDSCPLLTIVDRGEPTDFYQNKM
jgi:hypothetical protein